MTSLLITLVLSPILVYFIHAVFSRIAKGMPIQLTAILSILIGNIPVLCICLIIIYALRLPAPTLIVYTLIVYNAFAYIYFHVFNMSETARRIHILIRLKKTGKIKKQDLLCQYGSGDIVQARLERLVGLKQLKIENGKYKVDRRYLLIAARIYGFWARILGF